MVSEILSRIDYKMKSRAPTCVLYLCFLQFSNVRLSLSLPKKPEKKRLYQQHLCTSRQTNFNCFRLRLTSLCPWRSPKLTERAVQKSHHLHSASVKTSVLEEIPLSLCCHPSFFLPLPCLFPSSILPFGVYR